MHGELSPEATYSPAPGQEVFWKIPPSLRELWLSNSDLKADSESALDGVLFTTHPHRSFIYRPPPGSPFPLLDAPPPATTTGDRWMLWGRTPPACLWDPTVAGCNVSFQNKVCVFADDGQWLIEHIGFLKESYILLAHPFFLASLPPARRHIARQEWAHQFCARERTANKTGWRAFYPLCIRSQCARLELRAMWSHFVLHAAWNGCTGACFRGDVVIFTLSLSLSVSFPLAWDLAPISQPPPPPLVPNL